MTTTYSSALTTISPTYQRVSGSGRYYYEAVLVTVPLNGNYTFISSTNQDMYGYFYNNNFDPNNTGSNLIASNDDGGGNLQFLLTVSLQVGRTYILVVTTYSPSVTTSFAIIASGPSGFINFNKTIVTTTTAKLTTTTKTTTTKTTTVAISSSKSDNFQI